jgi:methylated-DNA-[protein]-cysteine S-methyltransferase
MTTTLYDTMPSPVGELLLVGDGSLLTGLHFGLEPATTAGAGSMRSGVGLGWRRDSAVFAEATAQLRAYFAGELRTFDLALAPAGTPFQHQVWDALTAIPYGETRSYGELAESIGQPGSARAVGAANGRNPIAIVVPCHRVVGADRSLTGYAGGLDAKRRLLSLEGIPA